MSLGYLVRYYLHFNTTFIYLIPKIDNPNSLDLCKPISLCDYIYKIIARLITMRVERLLYETISSEQLGFFLSSRQIHEVVGLAQEFQHTIKTKKIPCMVIKLDLFRAYDRVK
jgi:hypothetical protein